MLKHAWKDLHDLPQSFKDADSAELKIFQWLKDELTINGQANIILHDKCIVIPKAFEIGQSQ